MHILIVDDFAASAEVLGELLSDLGHTTNVAYSGTQALQAMRDQPPDLALLDINLPDLDGWQVAEALRADGSECYVVAMTAANVPTYVARSARSGCDRHVTKPVTPADLELLIKSAELRRSGQMPRRRTGAALRPATP
ncbi:MAG TPA: response regulator [Xanthomonadales bacterium]|nr:response regulator [Xanthomonadales bacterium]